MKQNLRNLGLALVFGGLLLSGCGKTGESYQKVTGPYLTGELAKYEYTGYVGIPLATLNSVVDQTGSNSQHIANFVEGLLENDQYGNLAYGMAESAFKTSDNKVFTFKIREGVKWLNNDGTQYVATVNGEQVPQFVTADDFLHSLQLNLDSKNDSQTSYIPSIFIQGAEEYNYYTEILARIKDGKPDRFNRKWPTSTTAADIAEALTKLNEDAGVADPIVYETDITAIKNFERVGIKVLDTYTIEFTLRDSMPFFPTVLTYTTFLPVNRAFIKQIGFKSFGTSPTKILYNGPFLLSSWDENQVVYAKNKDYWDAEHVHLNKVTYKNYPDNAAQDFIRKEFEQGNIDSFGVTADDSVGWEKYITGPDKTGTKENPFSGDVYARFVDSIDFNFHFMLNMERTEWSSTFSTVTREDVDNWNRAVSLSSVRQLFLKGIDLKTYNKQIFQTGDPDDAQTHTFTMRGFVNDPDNNRDYIEYVYDKYAAKYGLTTEQAAEILRPGQTDYNGYTNLDFAQVQDLAAQAKEDIALYNEAVGVTPGIEAPITFPIKAELLGTNDPTYFIREQRWTLDANERVNGCTIIDANVRDDLPLCDGGKFPFFEYSISGPDQIKSSSDYINLSDQHAYSIHIMGWAPDYGDPLTYLNCYTAKGEMSQYSGTNANPEKPAFHNEGGVLVEDSFDWGAGDVRKGVTAKYDYLVNKAKHEYNNTALRYELFAEAEVDLLTDLSLIRSIYNRGQGFFVTVSKVIGYESPTASYGLAKDKLKGIWVMKDTVGGAKRRELKQLYDQKRAEYDAPNIIPVVGA